MNAFMIDDETKNSHWDVLIVGAGSAGLTAALVLGRSRKKVLVCDTGRPRNAPATEAHGVLSRDGTPPSEILRIGREQLVPYPSVVLKQHAIVEILRSDPDGDYPFSARLDDGSRVLARKILLAMGVKDELPNLPGVEELWGKSLFHCPYCHAWEVRDEPLAVLGNGPMAFHLSLLLTGWTSDLVVCTNGQASFSSEERAKLEESGIAIDEKVISELDRTGERLRAIRFADGSELPRHGIFMPTRAVPEPALVRKLGCALTEAGYIQADEFGQTSVPSVFAAGDIVGMPHSVAIAMGRATMAAFKLNADLTNERLASASPSQSR